MENTNVDIPESPGKASKVLVFIFLLIAASTLVLASVYFYRQYVIGKNNKESILNQNTGLLRNSAPRIFTLSLPPAAVGKPYKTEVLAVVNGFNVPIESSMISGPSLGLKISECSMEYHGKPSSKAGELVNSVCTSTIEGTPQKSGEFTVRISFSVRGTTQTVYRDLQLVVNQ